MQTEKSQPEGKWIMLETRFFEFPALPLTRGLGFLGLHRRPMFDYFSYLWHSKLLFIIRLFCFIFDILRRITTFSERQSTFFVVDISDVTTEISSSDVTFNVAYELLQPIGKTKVSSTTKNRTNSV